VHDPGYDRLSDLNDKLQHVRDAHLHVPTWLLVLAGIIMVGLMVNALYRTWSQSRQG
jgi:hypothetical protein